MKVLNLRTDDRVEIHYEGAEYVADAAHPDFSTAQQDALNALVTELQTDGFQEIHIETNAEDNFVHKRANYDVQVSDNVNGYQIFVDLGQYAESLKPSHAPEDIDLTPQEPVWGD